MLARSTQANQAWNQGVSPRTSLYRFHYLYYRDRVNELGSMTVIRVWIAVSAGGYSGFDACADESALAFPIPCDRHRYGFEMLRFLSRRV